MKKAICFGINNYPGTANDLNGCANDALDWTQLLVSKEFIVETYLDSTVTIGSFKRHLKGLVDEAVAGDIIAVTYSGHGTQIMDYNNDEGDSYDEALYLYDGALADDDIRLILDGLKSGVQCFVAFDSCFSGTGTRKVRSDSTTIPRYYKTDDIPFGTVKKEKKGILIPEIYISGCSDLEYSYDAFINGRYNGAYTYYAIKAFKEGVATYKDWIDKIHIYLPSTSYKQTPQLECIDENTPVFDNVAIPPVIPEKSNVYYYILGMMVITAVLLYFIFR